MQDRTKAAIAVMQSTDGAVVKSKFITAEAVRYFLQYDATTGDFYWRPREGSVLFNLRFAGKKAGTPTAVGYISIGLNHKVWFAHRLVWLIEHGEMPDGEIDHIDGNRQNNLIGNLRCVSHQNNLRNQRRAKPGNSGVTGVFYNKKNAKYLATMGVDGKQIRLGQFSKIEDAVSARAKALQAYGFDKMHGSLR